LRRDGYVAASLTMKTAPPMQKSARTRTIGIYPLNDTIFLSIALPMTIIVTPVATIF
jgi:hypothetical protein